ncbi:MAG: DUF5103 domain-containing protein [Bacteroidales bacterium]|nr:DUF5103 domain-containing protein [Bacteroidales bacterium]
MWKFATLFFLFIFSVGKCKSEDDINFVYKNKIYKKDIKTVLLYKQGWELSYPIINLNSDEVLKLSFDDLDSTINNFFYTIIHCNSDWTESNIMPFDYIEGFNDNPINDYDFSINTTFKYSHYYLTIPNNDIRLKLSGNYVIKVYQDYNQDSVVFTKRFSILDQQVNINAVVKKPIIIEYSNTSQEIDFSIIHNSFPIDDPYNNLKVIIRQNNRFDNSIKNLKPLFVKDNLLIYDYDEDNLFTGGNEFRDFDIKTLRYKTQHVNAIQFIDPFYHVEMATDNKRTFSRYFYHKDLNGRYIIKNVDGHGDELDADYVYVYFTLPFDQPFIDGNLYVFGQLSNWNCTKQNQMAYNYERKMYELRMLLKQGYYDYEYAFVKTVTNKIDDTFIEGSHFETENDYSISVYYRDFGSDYDRLIGYSIINSVVR